MVLIAMTFVCTKYNGKNGNIWHENLIIGILPEYKKLT